jgi:hypothetical protein
MRLKKKVNKKKSEAAKKGWATRRKKAGKKTMKKAKKAGKKGNKTNRKIVKKQ